METKAEYAVEVVNNQVQLGSLAIQNSSMVIGRATELAKELARLIDDRKLFNNISGRKYVRVDGWATLGAMLGVLPREISVVEHETGDFEATVELVRANDGQIIGRGSAIVGSDEPTWKNRPRYARRSMAITRATGKAFRLGFSWIMTLAGYEPTPAEEMDGIVEAEVVHRQAGPVRKTVIVEPDHEEPEVKQEQPPTHHANGAVRPLQPEVLKEMLKKKATDYGEKSAVSTQQRGLVAGMLELCFAGSPDSEAKRHLVTKYLTGCASTNEVSAGMIKALLDWLKPVKDTGGAYQVDKMACTEMSSVYSSAQIADGQMDLLSATPGNSSAG